MSNFGHEGRPGHVGGSSSSAIKEHGLKMMATGSRPRAIMSINAYRKQKDKEHEEEMTRYEDNVMEKLQPVVEKLYAESEQPGISEPRKKEIEEHLKDAFNIVQRISEDRKPLEITNGGVIDISFGIDPKKAYALTGVKHPFAPESIYEGVKKV